MPYLAIHTNTDIPAAKHDTLLREASKQASESLGKPEQYVMVSLYPNESLNFAGNADPAAYIELKSIGLPESRALDLSASLCSFCEAHLGISPSRIYIEFSDAPRAMWGWNGKTFA
ncbi:MAG: phenylpyruvate tautomerase MIF-related protein [Verrucomicrobiota bacterium]